MRMTGKRGIVIGAGIGGIASGIALALKGLEVAIFESRNEVVEADHLLWIAPNGLGAMEQLGILDAVMQVATPQEIMGFTTSQQRPLMSLLGGDLAASLNHPIVAVRRRDLMQILFKRLYSLGGKIAFGHKLTHVSDDPRSVTVTFANGLRSTADFIIGADGMGSRVRGFVAGSARVRYQGLRTWLGYSDLPCAANYVGKTLELWGVGTRFVLTSLDGKRLYWSALERHPSYESSRDHDPDSVIKRLRELFADYHSDVVAALASAQVESFRLSNFSVVEELKASYRGRLLLIGDASHGMPPNMGQGASLALEDAIWAAALCSSYDDVAEAWAQFDRVRKSRVLEMMKLANFMNTAFQPKSSAASGLRNMVAAMIPDALTARRMIQLYASALPRPIYD
ncbi:MAG: hypothetical protein FJ146_12010 [Deltaproteobacteria bacterium]|nr:hypothetical protein [Deltaproteobacteria bacterium]